jgi:hypothetical protein
MKLRLSPDILALNPGLGASLTVEREQRAAKPPKRGPVELVQASMEL